MELRFGLTQSEREQGREPDALLGSLGEVYPRWRGMALMQSSTGRLLATRGEPLPFASLDSEVTKEASVRPVASTGKGVVMVATVPMLAGNEQRTLVAFTDLVTSEVPLDSGLGQSVLVVTDEGRVLDSRGPAPAVDARVSQGLINKAAAESAGGRTGSTVDLVAGNGTGPEGVREKALVVAHAPLTVAGLSGAWRLSLVSMAHVPVEGHTQTDRHPVTVVSLVVVAVFGFVLVRRTIVVPVHRLRTGALTVASGAGAPKSRGLEVREVRRIAAVLEQLSCAAEPGRRPRWWVPSARLTIVGAAATMLAWSCSVLVAAGGAAPRVPELVVRERGMEVSRIADTVRRSLNGAVADLKLLARTNGNKDTDSVLPLMERLIAREARYRSIYVVDSAGRIGARTGRPPLRAEARLPSGEGVRQYNTAGSLPVIFAYAELPDARHGVVAEFDVEHLSELLHQRAGRVRVVDPGFRTIADTEGYLAFHTLSEDSLRRSASEALAGRPRAEIGRSRGGESVIASAAIGAPGPAGTLQWSVISEQGTATLGLPENEVSRRALSAGLIGLVIALLNFGWHEFIVVRQLRRTATLAERLASGDHVSGIHPVRQDQIGTITLCLEICRKTASDSEYRKELARRES
ncbi:cache domain-containing protein [Amycolatopsis coloradensis]|uniref:Cache domain-containing protein n=1 Tax=Amycolatopsis coloradensis TaxID=76021 RepID=A0ACD5BPA2_9PSEU